MKTKYESKSNGHVQKYHKFGTFILKRDNKIATNDFLIETKIFTIRYNIHICKFMDG